jgi:hypothetical protein
MKLQANRVEEKEQGGPRSQTGYRAFETDLGFKLRMPCNDDDDDDDDETRPCLQCLLNCTVSTWSERTKVPHRPGHVRQTKHSL